MVRLIRPVTYAQRQRYRRTNNLDDIYSEHISNLADVV